MRGSSSQPSASQPPVTRSRPAGSGSVQQPAEVVGVRRSSRGHSDVAPILPPPETRTESQESRKVPGVAASRIAPGDVQQSMHDGVEADWGELRATESTTTFSSRVAECLRGYEDAGKAIRKLQEELKAARVRSHATSGAKRLVVMATIRDLKSEVDALKEKRGFILENSGPFKEKLLNDDRFRAMKGVCDPGKQTDDEGEEEEMCPGASGQWSTCSELPAEQVALPMDSSSAGEGDTCDQDISSSNSGGRLMAEIRQLQSPVSLQHFSFGADLGPEEKVNAKRAAKRKARRRLKCRKAGKIVEEQEIPLTDQEMSSSHQLEVVIFSRDDPTVYTWLIDVVKSVRGVKNVRPVLITNTWKYSTTQVPKCSLAILYHSKTRGRVNVTDVTDSLYDEELKDLSRGLGKERVIVVIDHLESTTEKEKTRILEHQPSIENLASHLLLFNGGQETEGANLKTLKDLITAHARRDLILGSKKRTIFLIFFSFVLVIGIIIIIVEISTLSGVESVTSSPAVSNITQFTTPNPTANITHRMFYNTTYLAINNTASSSVPITDKTPQVSVNTTV
ncbi:uncharacterized protein LOC142656703 [Rhinoderma darwinii]|uniref:uncharacterized protein LOC142656703 n=1 Tax=Rhinoderma darwinii TaxID=43563 RepID=UPI003F673C70